MDLQRFDALKKKLEEAKSKADKAAGKAEQLMAELKKNFAVTTIGRAKRKLRGLELALKEAEEELDQKLKEFETEYGDRL